MEQSAVSKLHQSLNHDFCPWANRYVYWLKKPIGWFVVAFMASLLLGLCVSPQAFLAAAAIAAIGLIGCLWPWIAMLGLRGELSWSERRCSEGDCIETKLMLTNRWPWPVWGMVVEADDAIANQVDAPDDPICLSRVPAMASSSFVWKCKPEARGVYPKKPVRLTTGFPFGIWKCERKLHVPSELIVWPRIVNLSDIPERPGTLKSSVGSASSQVGNEGDWMGVRPYRPGDSLRQVHWAQTARRDSLVVFERQSRSRQGVAICLDSNSACNCTTLQCEWLIRILASVTHHFSKHHWDVMAAIDGGWTTLNSRQTTQSDWLDRLAEWSPSASTNSTTALSSIRTPSKVIVICIADRVATLSEQFSNAGSDVHWVVLNTRTAVGTEPTWREMKSALQIDDAGDHAEQMQQGWNRYCQRSFQLS